MGDDQHPQTRTDLDADTWHTVFIDGEPITIDKETTVADLKDVVDAPDDDVLTYRDGQKLKALTDRQVVADHVADGAKAGFRPAGKQDLFGRH